MNLFLGHGVPVHSLVQEMVSGRRSHSCYVSGTRKTAVHKTDKNPALEHVITYRGWHIKQELNEQ